MEVVRDTGDGVGYSPFLMNVRRTPQRDREGLGMFFVTPLRKFQSFTEDATELARGVPFPYNTNRSLSNKIRKDIQCSLS